MDFRRYCRENRAIRLDKSGRLYHFLGTNDWWQGRTLGNLTDYTNNTGNNTVYGSFRIIMDKLHSLNKYPKFIDVPFNPETDEYPYPLKAINMTYDGLHPSDKGYKVMAKMLVKALK